MKKNELENLRKNSLADLVQMRRDSDDEAIKISAKAISKDAKVVRELKLIRFRISRLETIINEKIYGQE